MTSTVSFQNFFRDNPKALVLFDLSGNIQEINNMALRLLQSTDPDKFTHQNIKTIFLSPRCETCPLNIKDLKSSVGSASNPNLLQEPETIHTYILNTEESPAKKTHVMFQSYPDFYVAEIENQSERLQRELLEVKKRSLSITAEEVLKRISHNLKTPAAAASQIFDLLMQQDSENPLLQEGLKQLMEINRTIDEFSLLITLDAKKVIPSIRRFCLPKLLNDLERKMAPLAEAKKIHFKITPLFKNIPDLAVSDPQLLSTAIHNLIDNAIKFTNTGSVEVFVDIDPESKEKIKAKKTIEEFSLIIKVQDTGIGIPEDLQGEIFKPYFQAKSPSHFIQGNGLGLTIAKKIADLLEGTILLEKTSPEGATFALTTRIKVPKILLVDDTSVIRTIAQQQFFTHNLQCDLAENGQDALEKMRTHRYSLVLMDLQMPVMDGFESTRLFRIHEEQPPIPVVAITASVINENLLQKAKQNGLTEVLDKPKTWEDYQFILRKYLPAD